MIEMPQLLDYCERRLQPGRFNDYCPNGLQVEVSGQVRQLVTGVTASLALIEAAAAAGADTLLVHHGYFWKGEESALTGVKGRRVRALYEHGINLMAYHLPLDAHLELGNNSRLGARLGLAGSPVDEDGLLWVADLPQATSGRSLAGVIAEALDRQPLHIDLARPVVRVGWCTGGAQSYIGQAAAAGCDAFISGEISEQTTHLARELGLHYFAAGHHATERYGVQALGDDLADAFDIEHRYIEIDNPA